MRTRRMSRIPCRRSRLTFFQRDNLLAYLIICSASVFVLALFFPISLLSFLTLQPGSVANLSSTLAQILASLVGVLIAVLLVSFELMRRSYGEHPVRFLLENRETRELVILFWGATGFLIFSIVLSDQRPVHGNLSVLIGATLAAAFVRALFPYAARVIVQTTPTRTIGKIVASIQPGDIGLFGSRSQRESWPEFLDRLQHNPFEMLRQTAIGALQDRNVTSCQQILIGVAGKFLGTLTSPFTRGNAITAYLSFFKSILHEAFVGNHPAIIDLIGEIYTAVHIECAKNKAPSRDLTYLNQAIEELAIKSIKSGMTEEASTMLSRIESIMERHLDINVPPEEKIWWLQSRAGREASQPVDHEASIQWRHVSSDYLQMRATLVQEAIRESQPSVVSHGLFSLSHTIRTVVSSDKLGPLQKQDVVRHGCFHIKDIVLKSVENDVCRKSLAFEFPLTWPSDVVSSLKGDAPYWNIPLLSFGELLVELARRDAVEWVQLNNFGAAGRGLVEEATQEESAEDALLFVIDILEKVGKHASHRIQSEPGRRTYIEAYEQLVSIRDWKGEASLTANVRNALERAIVSFTDIENLKQSEKAQAVAWPTKAMPA